MKVILLVASVCVSMSCSLIDIGNDIYLRGKLQQHTLIDLPSDFIPTYNWYVPDLWSYTTMYIKARVKYKADTVDSWDSPATTLDRGYGDCDDFSILFMNLIYSYSGEKLNLIIVDSNKLIQSRKVVDGGYVNHALVQRNDGTIIEPQGGIVVQYSKVGYLYTFNEVFKH